ncbi:MAG TPA: alpha/beta fold hydrolase [Solirubrobacterales bacterium]|nr:alpha/beta fold hydrolase [Solirubrobacterales bacterium]
MTSATEWNPTYVDAAGLRLRVGRRGAGRPLLLITGIGAHLEMWAPLVRFVEDRELIAFDPPGAGLSERPRLPLRMRGLARVVADLLDALGLERVDVLGYSFGGALAQELARRAPDRVRRLVLCATGPGLGGSPPRPLAALMLATPARYYHPRLLALTVPHIAGGRTAREPDVLAEQAEARLSRSPDPLGYAYQLYAALGWSSLPWLHRVQHQSLIVAGEQDPAVPLRNARLLAGRLPHARLHVVKEGGHLFLLDEPENAAPPIRAFLDEDEGGMMRAAA